MKKMLCRPLAAVLLLLLMCSRGTAEIRSFNGRIDAASFYIHYSDGYVIAPGFVDISGLTFSTLEDEVFIPDADMGGGSDDDTGNDDGNGDRMLDDSDKVSGVSSD